ncbi:unnamed protein product, partial [Symbiodinium necroappetens]
MRARAWHPFILGTGMGRSPRLTSSRTARAARTRQFATVAGPVLRVDGSIAPERLLAELSPVTKGFLQAATLRTVGQAGLATTLQILAQLRQRRQAALFSLEYGEPEPLTGRSAETRGEGHNDVAKVFMVSLLPSAKWPLPEQRHLHSELTVTEKSSVKSLAMALAARVAQLPSDKQAVALSVDLRIHQTVRWHRLLKAAYAVATAHEWYAQAPVVPSLRWCHNPTRLMNAHAAPTFAISFRLLSGHSLPTNSLSPWHPSMSSYRFANLLGTTYKGGGIQFAPDGNVLLSPVGNRISGVDLVQGRSVTLAPENREDVAVLALTEDARLLLSVDLHGHALLINFVRCSILTRINFKARVQSAKWSPDARWLIVSHGRKIQLWRTPTVELGWQFVKERVSAGHHDDVVDLSWSSDSHFFASCSKDGTVRLSAARRQEGFQPMALLEHRSPVRAAFFSNDMQHIFSMSREGVLVSAKYTLKEGVLNDEEHRGKLLYCQPGTWAVESKAYCQQPVSNKVMRCAYDGKAQLMAVGFSAGVLMLFEMPALQALQTLSLGQEPLDAVALGANGDWLAVGSSGTGQLLVWEWRSETYVLKQQGHHYGVRSVAFSPGSVSMKRGKALASADARPEDRSSAIGGRLLATGGYDGKVKLFNAQSGLCFVTFAEHTAPVNALCFTPQGNAVLSASRDGSVRAFDLLRYRNFRTFASPDGLCQFSSVAVDSGGEIVAASSTGGKYAVYVWSIQTGNILEVLTGHTSHVEALHFSPSAAHPGQLVSASWDGTLNVWDLYAGTKGGSAEALQCSSSVVAVSFDPRGNDLCAAACLSGQVLFWNVVTAQNIGSIDGIRDIQSARHWQDMFSAVNERGLKPGAGMKKRRPTDGVNLNQNFNSIAYARSGELLLCSSRNSPFVSLY